MIKLLPPRTNLINGAISAVSTLLPVDAAFLAIIASFVDFGASDYFYLTLVEDNKREEVKVTNVSGSNLVIVRAQGGTTAAAFTLAGKYVVEMNKAAITDIATGLAPVQTVSVDGEGIAESSLLGSVYTVAVPYPNFTSTTGLEIAGAWPNIQFNLPNNGNCCAGEGSSGSSGLLFVGEGIAEVNYIGDNVTVNVLAPSFIGTGIQISGSWPNYQFTVTANGSGSVVSVGTSGGLDYTGDPNVNPTLFMSNTGVVAGSYGGIVINARGQLTAVPATLNPVSVVVEGTGIDVARTGDSITISAIQGAVGTVGVLALADADAPINETDETTAVTPKMLATIVAALEGSVGYGGATYSGEADGDYTVTLPTTAIALVLAAGQKAIVTAHTTARGAVVTDPVNYAIGVFKSSDNTRVQANKKVNQNEHSMSFVIDGPFTDGLTLKHTALAGGETVYSYSLIALKL